MSESKKTGTEKLKNTIFQFILKYFCITSLDAISRNDIIGWRIVFTLTTDAKQVHNMEKKQGKNSQNLKAENRGLLFRFLATRQQTSRTELAKISGLNKMTVSNITADFLAKQYVIESTMNATRNNPIMLELSPNAPKIIGLLIRRTRVAVALCNFHLDILSYDAEELHDATQEILLRTVKKLVDRFMRFGNILGIGIGSIGPVDIHQGIILDPPDFYGIRDVEIVDYLQKLYHLPVYLDYHYNCEALAELYYGNGSNYQNFLFLGIEDGLGLSVVIANQLLSNYTGYESEFGYLCVNFDDKTPRTGVPSGYLGAYVSFDASQKDQIRENISILSFSLAGLCNILNPQAIIIGDSRGVLSNTDLIAMQNQINQQILSRDYRHIEICRAYRSGNFETASCAISIIQHVFSGELIFSAGETDRP